MPEKKLGRQTPTTSLVLQYSETSGQEAVDLYEASGRECLEWQKILIYDIEARREDGLWTHSKFGYSVPRRNGKNEIISIRELHGIVSLGERILHTAHRTTTSTSASERLVRLLSDSGYTEVIRIKQGETYKKSYVYAKQKGLEKVTILDEGGGCCYFRTRSGSAGLGEGFDCLVIDEAQEYTQAQETALKYVVSDSKNPQTILCGTPPTEVSAGTVFPELRESVLDAKTFDTGWAEWSVKNMSPINDTDLWYETNPSLGYILTERKIRMEAVSNETDFNIQRLGLWLKYNQRSAISENEWKELQSEFLPKLKGKLHVGIKYGHSGENVSLAIACRTSTNKIFVESILCKPIRQGNGSILSFLQKVDAAQVVIDGANGQNILAEQMREARLNKPILPTVKQVIDAGSLFEQGLENQSIVHMDQQSLTQAITNCQKRPIGTHGGFGYETTINESDSALIDAILLAHWSCATNKEEPKKQKVSY